MKERKRASFWSLYSSDVCSHTPSLSSLYVTLPAHPLLKRERETERVEETERQRERQREEGHGAEQRASVFSSQFTVAPLPGSTHPSTITRSQTHLLSLYRQLTTPSHFLCCRTDPQSQIQRRGGKRKKKKLTRLVPSTHRHTRAQLSRHTSSEAGSRLERASGEWNGTSAGWKVN